MRGYFHENSLRHPPEMKMSITRMRNNYIVPQFIRFGTGKIKKSAIFYNNTCVYREKMLVLAVFQVDTEDFVLQ